jgi:hypothetical protein
MFHRYLLVLLFGAGLLAGIQGPSFAGQYATRIDAHWHEVVENLKAFQHIADRFHGGSLDALIAHHRASPDSTFRAEAEAIGRMAARKARFGAEREALRKGGFARRASHILLTGDREVLRETRDGYVPEIRLDRDSLTSGLGLALACCLLLEALLFGLRRAFSRGSGS